MWDFLKNITCNVIASVIIYILGIVAAVVYSDQTEHTARRFSA